MVVQHQRQPRDLLAGLQVLADFLALQFHALHLHHRAGIGRVAQFALVAQRQAVGQRIAGDPAGEDGARRDFRVHRQRREAAERMPHFGHHGFGVLARGGVDRDHAQLGVDQRIGAHWAHEGARQQFGDQVFLDPLARAPARLAAFLLFQRRELLLQQVVDHRRRQQFVLAAHGQPQRFADGVGQRFAMRAERRDEAARGQFQRADRLERAFGQLRFEIGEIERSRETEQRQVAEEHAESESLGYVIPSAARNPLFKAKAGPSLRSG